MVPAVLSEAIEARDPYTRGHSSRVTALAEVLARRLGWEDEGLATLRLGGPLHDIGKLSLDKTVLQKPGPLSAAERAEIRRHPEAGATLIASMPALRPALPYVLYHHERWDGAGYPSGKAGEQIPVEARVLAVADAFDAMTTARPYRPALSPEQAVDEVQRCAGSQFDPTIARVFVEAWKDGEVGAATESPRLRASTASGG